MGLATQSVLTINGGSSSIKFALYRISEPMERMLAEIIDRIGLSKDSPIIFAYHGYPWLIHRLTCRRSNHRNLHVRGYKENGTTTTPFDMAVLNDLDRFHLAGDVIDRVQSLGARADYVKQFLRDKLLDHKA